MIDEKQAMEIAIEFLIAINPEPNYAITKLVNKPYGYIIYYKDRRYLETGEPYFQLFPGFPLVVEKTDGSVHVLALNRYKAKRINSVQDYDYQRIVLGKSHDEIDF
jgi:hypothetical protein